MRYVKKVKSTLKQGVDVELSPRTVIVGPNGAGKTSVVQTMELATCGWAGDMEGRSRVKLHGALARLFPDDQPMVCEVWLDDDTHFEWRMDLTAETARLKHHQANNEALKEAEQRGELLPAEFVILHCSALVAAARAKFLALPAKLRSRFAGLDAEVVEEVDDQIREALTELADDGLSPEVRNRVRGTLERMQAGGWLRE